MSLSILLPFISAPLIYLTCSKKVMRVAIYDTPSQPTPISVNTKLPESSTTTVTTSTPAPRDAEVQSVEYVNMANGWVIAILSWLIWTFITGLNVYLIVMLCLGQS